MEICSFLRFYETTLQEMVTLESQVTHAEILQALYIVEQMIRLHLQIPVNTRHCLDVNSTLFERYGRHMDVKTTLCYCDGVSRFNRMFHQIATNLHFFCRLHVP